MCRWMAWSEQPVIVEELLFEPRHGPHRSTDSEVLFHLALTYGLEQDPVAALERAVGLVEATAVRHGIERAVQASIGVTDGERLWAFRCSTEGFERDRHASRTAHPQTMAAPARNAPPERAAHFARSRR
jgi:predicted glutamine amidotransferase